MLFNQLNLFFHLYNNLKEKPQPKIWDRQQTTDRQTDRIGQMQSSCGTKNKNVDPPKVNGATNESQDRDKNDHFQSEMVIDEALLHTRDGLIYKLQTNDNLFNSLRSTTKFYVNLLMPQHCCDTQIVKSGVKEEKYETSLG